jgi:hypothetical protein
MRPALCCWDNSAAVCFAREPLRKRGLSSLATSLPLQLVLVFGRIEPRRGFTPEALFFIPWTERFAGSGRDLLHTVIPNFAIFAG